MCSYRCVIDVLISALLRSVMLLSSVSVRRQPGTICQVT